MERDRAIDSTKFLLICLVIFAHALEVCRDTDWLSEKVYIFIYSFHMPAFIILSGYFFKDNDNSKFWKGVVNLFLTYLFFQIALCGNPLTYSTADGPLVSQLIDGLRFNVTHLYLPAGALWYIVSLAFWRMLLHFIPYSIRDSKATLVIGVAFIICIVGGFFPMGRELSFQRTVAFFPYFLLGYYAKRFDGYAMLKRVKVQYALVIVTVYAIIVFAIGHFPLSMLVQFFDYYELGNPIYGVGMRIVSFLWMLPLTLAILRLFANVTVFYNQGRNTLFYYIYHMYAIMGMRIVLNTVLGGVNLVIIIFISSILILLLFGISRFKILYRPLAFIK